MMDCRMNHPLPRRFPVAYFALTFAFSWVPWGLAAYSSTDANLRGVTLSLALLGLLGPCLAAFVMMAFSGQGAWRDFRARWLNVSAISVPHALFALGLIPVALLIATLISVSGGYGSPDQFLLSGGFIGMLPLAFLAAVFEELGWRGYGVDSLRGRGSLLRVCLLFAVFWAAWHIPLFFIEQTYQHGLRAQGSLYVANFFISVLPAAVLSTWLYDKSHRSIPAAVLFHFALVAFSELLQTEQVTKCFFTGVLMIVSFGLVVIERDFFFRRNDGA